MRQGSRGRWHWRWGRFLLASLLVLLSLPVFAALALAIRLWTGPIDVTDSARRLLAAHGGADVAVARVQLAWNGWREGPRAPLGLLLDDVRWGHSRVGHATAALDFMALLHGRAGLLALRIDDAAISLRRGGGLGLYASGPGHSGPDRLDYSQLQEVGFTHTTLMLAGALPGLSCRADVGSLLLDVLRRPAATGVSGSLAANLSCGGPVVALRGAGREGPEGDIVWRLSTGPLVPAALARGISRLAALGGLDLPVALTLRTTLSGGLGRVMLPRTLDLTATLGAGTLGMAAADQPGLPVASGSIRLAVDLPEAPGEPIRAAMPRATLVLAGPDAPTVQLDGAGSVAGDAIHATLGSRIAQFDFAGLQRYWPALLAPGGRHWVTGNITTGIGRRLVASASLESASGISGLRLTRLAGGVDASGLRLFWLRPVAPLRGMDAHLVLEGPDALRIDSAHAVQDVQGHSAIEVGPTTMRITGLSRKDQSGRIDTRLRGGLRDVLALLAHPRLQLLSRHPMPFTDPSGSVDCKLSVALPLDDSVRIDDVSIRADAALAHVHLGGVAAGRDLDAGTLTVGAGDDGLELRGNGALAGVPATLTYSMDFRAGGPRQSTERAHVAATIDDAAVHREGLDSAHRLSGHALADLDYDHHRDGSGRITMRVDLTAAGITLPGWRKPAGGPAQASGVLGLQDGQLVSLEALHAEGPGLSLDGHVEVARGQARALVLERFSLGRSRGAGRIELPAAGRVVHVTLHGAVLDLAPFLSAASPGSTRTEGRGWRAEMVFRKVLIGADRGVGMVTLHAEANGARVASARLAIGIPTSLTATLSPENGGRRLVVEAGDTGALLRALGVGERIEGGVLKLDGRMEDRPAGVQLTGQAAVGAFTINDPPLAARVARDLSIYGFVKGAAGRQLAVTRAEIPFAWQGDTLTLNGAQASNAALGATLRGTIDLRQQILDLRGTVVPSYLFNAMPGRLPGVGRVFSPEQGGGLLAITVRITGAIDRPVVRANPLSLLAPGILRRLLFD